MGTDELQRLHETFLYPVVRVFGKKGAGSGTLIYSKEDPKNKGDFLSFVLTNHHVVEDCIEYKKEWDSVVKKDVEKEFKDRPHVETFSYVRESTVDSSNRYQADIIAYDKNEDLAVLRVDSPRQFPVVATLIPREEIKGLRLFMDVVTSGCSMSHDPFCNFGQITYLKEMIENKLYLMANSGMIFGNSGGALFLKDNGWMIGVPSRLQGVQLGLGVDMITFMGFSAHPERIYEFIDAQELKFIYDPKDNYHKAMYRRKNKEKEGILSLKAQLLSQGDKKEGQSGGESE